MKWHDTKAGRSFALVLALGGGCSAMDPNAGLRAEAVHDEGLFELDQNATEEMADGDDWATVNLGGGGSSADHTGVLVDEMALVRRSLVDTTTFQGGGSKDDLDISSWRHTSGSSPDKDEITNAYAASYVSDSAGTEGDTIVYFGMDRIDTSGNANMGFWFLQQELGRNANGTFDGVHTVGDILVQVDFANGGSVPNVRVLEWVGTGGEINGTLDLHTEDSANCVAMDPAGQDDVCATTNPVATASPWEYIRKGSTTDGDFPANSFVEGGINISNIFEGGTIPCFASFVAVTRASDSVDAVLHDFVMGSFQSCGIEISKTCDQGTLVGGSSFEFDYHLTITNSGSGTLHDVTVTDDHGGTCTPVALGNIGSLAGGAEITLDCTFTSSENGPFTNNASVEASAVAGGDPIVSDTTSDTCEAADINAAMTVTKTCDPRLEVVGDRVVVTVDGTGQVCNTGNVGLTGVVVTDDCGSAPDQTQNIGTIPIAAGTETGCRTWNLSCAPNMSDPDPEDASFSDGASATGTAAIGGATVNDSTDANAVCDLCPSENPT